MLETYLDSDVTVLRSNGTDAWGEPLPRTAETLKARINMKTRRIRTNGGREVTSLAVIWLADGSVTHEDRLVVRGQEWSIVAIEEVRDFETRLIKVWIG